MSTLDSKLRPATIIVSPYAGDVKKNILYAKRCMEDSIARGEAPFASHLLYTQCLDDAHRIERRLGIEMEKSWALKANLIAAYIDLGLSPGMVETINFASTNGVKVELRQIGIK